MTGPLVGPERTARITALRDKVEAGLELDEAECLLMYACTLDWLALKDLLVQQGLTLKALRALLLGEEAETGADLSPDQGKGQAQSRPKRPKKPAPKGHGKHAAKDFRGCRQADITPDGLTPGDPCPECVGERKGRLHQHKPSRPLMRLRLNGSAPITGTVYRGFPLACSKCGAVIAPTWPDDAQRETYAASVKATVAMLRHWYGFPAYRLEKLQREHGIPLPDATQSDLIADCAAAAEPVFHALYAEAAKADLFIIDDTSARIQTVIRDHKKHPDQERYGAHVTGIIARTRERDLHIYRVGTLHAGENLEDLLALRPADLPRPIQMSDAAAVNTAHPCDTLVTYCLQHARGQIEDVVDHFPGPCRKILAWIAEVYRVEEEARVQGMDDQARLHHHQAYSTAPMNTLFAYLTTLLSERRVEPASGLGKAAIYILKRKESLTRFLNVPDVPLDSNAVERALKCAVLIRKNSLFYHNEVSAYRAGTLMTLAGSCVAVGRDPISYMTALVENRDAVATAPEDWLPWRLPAAQFETLGC
ncbi:Transposase [Sulfidibacter corallicola]|uniref:Transposase n=1 Tax=Sulfidibacter corallicola TaxID=2818388 RepID=A0A8A4TP33_SULCO|nr:transposase [Sulfidibacter corallicola]QTD51726.1 transposase [Sulfidibacter corallicola]